MISLIETIRKHPEQAVTLAPRLAERYEEAMRLCEIARQLLARAQDEIACEPNHDIGLVAALELFSRQVAAIVAKSKEP